MHRIWSWNACKVDNKNISRFLIGVPSEKTKVRYITNLSLAQIIFASNDRGDLLSINDVTKLLAFQHFICRIRDKIRPKWRAWRNDDVNDDNLKRKFKTNT